MQVLNGNTLSKQIKEEIAVEVQKIVASGGKKPHLAAVIVGNDGASETYVSHKIKSCEQCGFTSTLIRKPAEITEAELLDVVNTLNNDADIDGFIVQLPLPKHINADAIIHAIKPAKDVDGFTPINFGRMALGMPCYIPATPFGILKLLERNNIETTGKHCVVVGRSNIVGKPMSLLLAQNSNPGNCTVTLTHSKTKNLPEETLRADILIAAIGIPEFIKANMVKEGAVVIDVGITRVPDASNPKGFILKGDVAYDEVSPKCSYITPVPGGVGPMTVTMLLYNTLLASQKKIY